MSRLTGEYLEGSLYQPQQTLRMVNAGSIQELEGASTQQFGARACSRSILNIQLDTIIEETESENSFALSSESSIGFKHHRGFAQLLQSRHANFLKDEDEDNT